MNRQLIVTCDDCGLSRGINLATAELHEKGIATAASVVTNFPAAHHAFELFSHYPDLEVGVHLNLTDGYPLTAPESPSAITQANGRFFPKGVLHVRALMGGANFRAVAEAEMRAQIEVCIQAGVRPQHLTTHQHFHAMPPLRKIVLRLAKAYNIPWIRSHELTAGVIPQNPFYRRQKMASKDIPMPDHLVGMKWWVGHDPERLVSVLKTLQGSIEFVIHPSTREDATYPPDVAYLPHERHLEMRYLERVYPLVDALLE